MINSKYRPVIFWGVYSTGFSFIMELFVFTGNAHSKYHILGVAISSIIGGICGMLVFAGLNKWFKNQQSKQAAAE